MFINLLFDMIHVNIVSLTEFMEQFAGKDVSAGTVNSFHARLDRFWTNEEMYYNYKAIISCTRSLCDRVGSDFCY